MRRLPLVPIPVLMVLLATGCQPSAEPIQVRTPDEMQADVEALRASADDFAGVAALYTTDAYYVDQYGGVHDGQAAISGYFEQSLPLSAAYDIMIDGSVTGDDLVASYGTWSATLTGPEGEVPASGRWQTVGVYEPDGTLKLRLHFALVPAPAPPAPTPAT
jgi:ketosteroid isomerase-like protein